MPQTKKKAAPRTPGAAELKDLPLDVIVEPAHPERFSIDQARLDDLAASIRAVGLLQPISVRPAGAKYEIIHGHRRFLACQRLGKATVRCIVEHYPADKTELARVHENLNRQDPTPLEEATYIAEIAERHKLNNKRLSTLLGRSESWISDRLQMLHWPEDIQAALQEGSVVYSVARELAKVGDPKYRNYLLTYAKGGGATPQTARRWVEEWRTMNYNTPPEAEPPEPHGPPATNEPPMQRCHLCDSMRTYDRLVHIWVEPECLKAVINAAVQMSEPQDQD